MSADVIRNLLDRIVCLQSTGDSGYTNGLFPAQRVYVPTGRGVDDDSIFPTAVVVYILSTLANHLDYSESEEIEEIRKRAIRNYPSYASPGGDKIYNFWNTTPEHRPFPGSRWKLRNRIFRLPEDIDTTAYIYLTDDVSKEQAAWLKERIKRDTNLNTRAVRNTPARYRKIRAYSTWLESVEMPVDFDACALSNLLLLIRSKDLPHNEYDAASIELLREVVESGDFIRRPFDVSPWYAETALIIYHVVRLVTTCRVPELDAVMPKLDEEIGKRIGSEPDFMNRILLSTSAMRLGGPPLLDDSSLRDAAGKNHAFYYFRGSPLAGRENPLLWKLARYPLFQVRFKSEAVNLALLLEHEVLRKTSPPPL